MTHWGKDTLEQPSGWRPALTSPPTPKLAQWTTDPNARTETLKLPEKNMAGNLCDFSLQSFLHRNEELLLKGSGRKGEGQTHFTQSHVHRKVEAEVGSRPCHRGGVTCFNPWTPGTRRSGLKWGLRVASVHRQGGSEAGSVLTRGTHEPLKGLRMQVRCEHGAAAVVAGRHLPTAWGQRTGKSVDPQM